MVQNGQITFYTQAYSPHCHRVHIALEEVKAEYTLYSIDVMNKPAWYITDVNPTGKIPAITFGGPAVAPNQPSAEAFKLADSLVTLEFLADLFPSSGLLPIDPIARAKARFFITAFEATVFEGFKGFFFMGAPAATLVDAIDALQKLLPATGFAAGDKWSTADIAAAPFLARIVMLLGHDLGRYPVGEGKKTLEVLRGEKFARFNQYLEDLKAQPSFKATWDEDAQFAIWSSNPIFKRE